MLAFRTIRTKILSTVLSVFFLALLIQTVSQYRQVKHNAFMTMDSINETITKILVEYTTAYIYNQDEMNIQLTIDAIDSQYIKAIFILDENGVIITRNGGKGVQHIKHPKFEALYETPKHSIKNSDEYLTLTVFSILDVPVGYMIVEANVNTYYDNLYGEMKVHLFEIAILSIVFIAFSILLSNSLSAPLEKIIEKLQKVKSNELMVFEKQEQEEFQYLCNNISHAHNLLRSVNENLESEVNKKTQELQVLNKTLERRVEEAVKEIADKNNMLQQQSRLAQMGEMISMIAHQWRQPLATISAVTISMKMSFALEKFDLSTQKGRDEHLKFFEHNLDEISDLVQSLTSTINDFRNFFKHNKEREIVSINGPVQKALNIIEVSMKNRGIVVDLDLSSKEKLPMLGSELMQVVLNILKNAQDNFEENGIGQGKITISTRDIENGVLLEISDNGSGIDEEVLPYIFDPYFSTKDEKNGTGLGLYMSKTIVEEHHQGKLEVFNKEPGVCFRIEITKA